MSDITVNNFKAFYEQIRPYLGAVHSGFTPIGTIISVMGTTAPLNYLACDGTVYNIADYTELAAYFNQQFGSSNFFGGDGTTTFAVPDLRGEFLRGTGTNSHANQGSGAAVGVHQDGTSLASTSGGYLLTSSETNGLIKNYDSSVHNSGADKYVKVTENGTGYDDFTVRPTNTSVLYCIASKNIFMDAGSNYSTEEQVVGTWIDGKPIYQKTIQATTPSSSTNNWMTISSALGSNVGGDNIVDIITCVIDWDGANGRNVSPTYFNATNNFYTLTIVQGYFAFNFAGTWLADVPIVFTVQYTKTTD